MTAHNKLAAALLLVLTLLTLLLGSCATSLYLLGEEEKDLVFRDELVGRWKLWEEDGSPEDNVNYAVVKKGEDSLYHIMTVMNDVNATGRKDTSYFFGFLLQVDSFLFLNCLADTETPSFKEVGEYTMETMLHTAFICPLFFRNKNEVLELWELEYTPDLKAVLDTNKVAYRSTSEYSVLLLAPSAGLRKLMVRLVREHPAVWQKRLLLRMDEQSAAPVAATRHPDTSTGTAHLQSWHPLSRKAPGLRTLP